jgi:SAM-dependent methyltransferase
LEHVADDRKAMSELRRILRPSGTAIIMVPLEEGLDETYENPSIVSEADRLIHFGQARISRRAAGREGRGHRSGHDPPMLEAERNTPVKTRKTKGACFPFAPHDDFKPTTISVVFFAPAD